MEHASERTSKNNQGGKLYNLPPHIERDFYEYFVSLDDAVLKQGYERLVFEILQLAEIPPATCSVTWEGVFGGAGIQHPYLTVSRGRDVQRFVLQNLGESVDLEHVLTGVNAFIVQQRPHEQRRLFALQQYNDQWNCIWFLREEQLRALCQQLHASWEGYPEHLCTVTRRDALREGGEAKVLEIATMNAQRTLRKLNNKKWLVYPAKTQGSKNTWFRFLLIVGLFLVFIAIVRTEYTTNRTGCLVILQRATPLLNKMPRNQTFTSLDVDYTCTWDIKKILSSFGVGLLGAGYAMKKLKDKEVGVV